MGLTDSEYTSVNRSHASHRPATSRFTDIVSDKRLTVIMTSPTGDPDLAERQAAHSGLCADSSLTNATVSIGVISTAWRWIDVWLNEGPEPVHR